MYVDDHLCHFLLSLLPFQPDSEVFIAVKNL